MIRNRSLHLSLAVAALMSVAAAVPASEPVNATPKSDGNKYPSPESFMSRADRRALKAKTKKKKATRIIR